MSRSGSKPTPTKEPLGNLSDNPLRYIGANFTVEHHLWACEFESEVLPFEDPLGC